MLADDAAPPVSVVSRLKVVWLWFLCVKFSVTPQQSTRSERVDDEEPNGDDSDASLHEAPAKRRKIAPKPRGRPKGVLIN